MSKKTTASKKFVKRRKYNTKRRKQQRAMWLLLIGATLACQALISGNYYVLAKELEATTNEISIPMLKKEYKYNEQVPKEVIKEEIIKQARLFGVDEKKALALAKCESGFNNLTKNNERKTNTALGVYQFVIATWQETDSFKLHRIARTDYKANIKEAMIKLARGESSHWLYCGRQAGFHN